MLISVSSAFVLETTYLQWVSNNETQENWTKKSEEPVPLHNLTSFMADESRNCHIQKTRNFKRRTSTPRRTYPDEPDIAHLTGTIPWPGYPLPC